MRMSSSISKVFGNYTVSGLRRIENCNAFRFYYKNELYEVIRTRKNGIRLLKYECLKVILNTAFMFKNHLRSFP